MTWHIFSNAGINIQLRKLINIGSNILLGGSFQTATRRIEDHAYSFMLITVRRESHKTGSHNIYTFFSG